MADLRQIKLPDSTVVNLRDSALPKNLGSAGQALVVNSTGDAIEWSLAKPCNFATFEINPTTGILSAKYTDDDSEILFSLNNGYLEVEIQ